ncbi:conjugal transfer transcriptional regulator TraJ [Nitrosomonas sp. Is37]|uniref:conjugal transfer transcriptional regulator TraJ n=1 Tax=Nitrosomonas sp. Is37 TaxID=3080535 RepID=UPI00294AF292|nr:conjugal transfer transcriptional regulator TraJ [Nitrosomonas sp. Is37]MDV6344755.1 conjugal transfer transcriptional regulator TraJ [Nitrosomonas sp. Is37]
MSEKARKDTRRSSAPIKVYCTPAEREQIEANARKTGLTRSSYLLKIGMNYRVTGIVDNQQVERLAKINGDLGRLGGLIKLWLSNDRRTKELGKETLHAVLGKINDTQHEMIKIMAGIIRHGG